MEFHIEASIDGRFVWRALDEDGVEVVRSRPLLTRQECVRAVLAFKVEAATAPVLDLSAEAAADRTVRIERVRPRPSGA